MEGEGGCVGSPLVWRNKLDLSGYFSLKGDRVQSETHAKPFSNFALSRRKTLSVINTFCVSLACFYHYSSLVLHP